MRDPMVGAIKRHANGVRVRVRLTPKSAQDDIDSEEQLSDGSIVLSVRVRAIPANGRANAALETLLAKTVGVAKSRVSVVSGATSRIKIVDIQVAAGDIAARLMRDGIETINRNPA